MYNHYEPFNLSDEAFYISDEGADDDIVLEDSLNKKGQETKHPHARRSVDEYFEHKRIRKKYKELFDDYFGEGS